MSADCRATGRNLRLRKAAAAAVRPAPSLYFDEYLCEVGKRDIRISDAATRLANALHLHLTRSGRPVPHGSNGPLLTIPLPAGPAGAVVASGDGLVERRTRRSRWRSGCRS